MEKSSNDRIVMIYFIYAFNLILFAKRKFTKKYVIKYMLLYILYKIIINLFCQEKWLHLYCI